MVRSKGERSAGVGGDMPEPLKWYEDNADNPAWIKALAEVRRFFLNKPHGIGGGMKDDIP